MVVGVITIKFYLHGVFSLKEKRSVVRRIIHRTKNKFELSVAEVDAQDHHQTAVVGVAVVTNDARLANSILDKVLEFVEQLHLAEITDSQIEILHI